MEAKLSGQKTSQIERQILVIISEYDELKTQVLKLSSNLLDMRRVNPRIGLAADEIGSRRLAGSR